MAQRLATEYVKTCLRLKEVDLPKLARLFEEHQVQMQVKIMENGAEELSFVNGSEEEMEEIALSIQRESDHYICTGSCRFSNIALANAMRMAVSMFKGEALVHRIYRDCIVIYEYTQGKVARISEWKQGQYRLIYELKDTVGELKKTYMNDKIEKEIAGIQGQINQLLDLRNTFSQPELKDHIDQRLAGLTHKLFVLEA